MLVNSNHFLSTLLLPPVPIRWVLSDLGIPLLSQVAHKSNVTFYKFPELLIIFSFASFNFTDKTVGRLQWDWNLDRQRRRRVGWPIDCQHTALDCKKWHLVVAQRRGPCQYEPVRMARPRSCTTEDWQRVPVHCRIQKPRFQRLLHRE